jgi:lycopene beta-cyclase
VSEGVAGRILLVDARSDYADDRTWCFWDVEPTPFTHLARATWETWSVRSTDGTVRATASATPYRCLSANDFYRFALDSLAASGRVQLLLGAAAGEITAAGDHVAVAVGDESIEARRVVDSRGLRPGSPELQTARETSTWLPQHFVGLHLRVSRPVFDPTECTLMDFDVDQSAGLRFVYVLPLSPFEALVEDVSLSDPALTDDDHRRNLRDHLRERFGLGPDDYEIVSEERGCIPMTDHLFARRPRPGVTTLGTLAGATRPSTGYTFLRIQRSSRDLARALASGSDGLDDAVGRRPLLDSIFLRFLADHPDRGPRVFHLLFARVRADALVRFLSEQSTLRDHLRLVVALPKGWFLATAFRELVARSRRARRG